MKKNTLLFILLIAFTFNLTGCEKIDPNRFQSEKGFSIVIPEGWKRLEKTEDYIFAFYSPEGSSMDIWGADVVVAVTDNDKATPIKMLLDEYKKAKWANRPILRSGNITMDNTPAKFLLYKHDGVKTAHHIVVNPDWKVFTIFCSADETVFDKQYMQLFGEMIASFRFEQTKRPF